MKDPKKVAMGKKSRAAGKAFELKVAADLENDGWIVMKWSKNVELPKLEEADVINIGHNSWIKRLEPSKGRLVNTRPKFNPFTKSMMMNSGGVPDFIAFRKRLRMDYMRDIGQEVSYDIMGVECKTNGVVSSEYKNIFNWLLDYEIFNRILIARKGEKRGAIVYNLYNHTPLDVKRDSEPRKELSPDHVSKVVEEAEVI